MPARLLLIGALCSLAILAAKPREWYSRVLPDAAFEARLVRDVNEIERLVGDRFDGEVILAELRVKPLYGSKVVLDRAHFLVRARNDNSTSPAQSPDRIAGAGVLALGKVQTSGSGGVFAEDPNAPIWGGAPGTGTRPRRVGGPPRTVGGGSSGEEVQTVDARTEGEGPVLASLRARELPLDASEGPVSGYLYFEIEAKVKRKHLELSYDGPLGEFLIEFGKAE